MRPMLLVGLMVLAACGGDGPSGPSIPEVDGTYAGSITLDASSSAGNENLATATATATVTQDGEDLSVGVVVEDGSSFTFTGTIAAGGAVTLNPPDIGFLVALLPQCSFAGAVATNSGSIVGDTFTATAAIAGAACPWVGFEGLLPTSFVYRFEGDK